MLPLTNTTAAPGPRPLRSGALERAGGSATRTRSAPVSSSRPSATAAHRCPAHAVLALGDRPGRRASRGDLRAAPALRDRAADPVTDRRRRARGRPVPRRLRVPRRRYPAQRRGGILMSEEMDEFGTPWRRDLDEIRDRVRRLGGGERRRRRGRRRRRVARQRHVERDRLVRGRAQRHRATTYAARLAPMPEVYPVFPQYDLELQRRCMDLVRAHTDVPAPEVVWYEARREVGRHAVPRDAPRRRRRAARHPAVRVRRLDDGRDAGAAAHPPGLVGERARAAARDHATGTTTSRSSRSPSTARPRSTSSSATSAGTTTGRARA